MLNHLEKIKDESVKLTEEVTQKTLNFIITAFGLVAGLAWNEAIQALINSLFSISKNTILAKFIYAILMTLILALITIYLAKALNKSKK
ncbi:MAG: DUF5654 family protein [Patescibacteria group bacterium]